MDTTYDGSNSVIFDDVDSWEAWGLVPASRPTINLPSVRTNTIDIPGMNGVLDLSEVPLGYPTYGNRSGSLKFNVAHDKTGLSWDTAYSKIAAALHGRKVRCILKEDKSFYYEGRTTVGEWQTGQTFSTLSITYDFAPYKLMRWTTTEDWLWNPFDFVNGVILQSSFKDIPIISGVTKHIEFTQDFIGMAPVSPVFTVISNQVSSGMTLAVQNTGVSQRVKTFTLSSGLNYNPQIEFSCPTQTSKTILNITGDGTLSIDFRPGRL